MNCKQFLVLAVICLSIGAMGCESQSYDGELKYAYNLCKSSGGQYNSNLKKCICGIAECDSMCALNHSDRCAECIGNEGDHCEKDNVYKHCNQNLYEFQKCSGECRDESGCIDECEFKQKCENGVLTVCSDGILTEKECSEECNSDGYSCSNNNCKKWNTRCENDELVTCMSNEQYGDYITKEKCDFGCGHADENEQFMCLKSKDDYCDNDKKRCKDNEWQICENNVWVKESPCVPGCQEDENDCKCGSDYEICLDGVHTFRHCNDEGVLEQEETKNCECDNDGIHCVINDKPQCSEDKCVDGILTKCIDGKWKDATECSSGECKDEVSCKESVTSKCSADECEGQKIRRCVDGVLLDPTECPSEEVCQQNQCTHVTCESYKDCSDYDFKKCSNSSCISCPNSEEIIACEENGNLCELIKCDGTRSSGIGECNDAGNGCIEIEKCLTNGNYRYNTTKNRVELCSYGSWVKDIPKYNQVVGYLEHFFNGMYVCYFYWYPPKSNISDENVFSLFLDVGVNILNCMKNNKKCTFTLIASDSIRELLQSGQCFDTLIELTKDGEDAQLDDVNGTKSAFYISVDKEKKGESYEGYIIPCAYGCTTDRTKCADTNRNDADPGYPGVCSSESSIRNMSLYVDNDFNINSHYKTSSNYFLCLDGLETGFGKVSSSGNVRCEYSDDHSKFSCNGDADSQVCVDIYNIKTYIHESYKLSFADSMINGERCSKQCNEDWTDCAK